MLQIFHQPTRYHSPQHPNDTHTSQALLTTHIQHHCCLDSSCQVAVAGLTRQLPVEVLSAQVWQSDGVAGGVTFCALAYVVQQELVMPPRHHRFGVPWWRDGGGMGLVVRVFM